MISNVVSFLPTILGLAWSATTAVPVIECASRAIWHSGELAANRAQFHTCTVNSLYVEEKNQFIKDIKADFNSKLPTSCLPDTNKPEAPKLKLKFVNSDDLEVDRETFKLFCGTFKTLSIDYSDVEANEFLMPSPFNNEEIEAVKTYLIYKSNLNLYLLADKHLMDTYDLARFLDMPDLEAKCMKTIVKRYIKTESTVLKSGLKNLDHRYAKEFNRLFDNVDQLKTGHLSEALVTRKNLFDEEKTKVVKKIVNTALFVLLLTPMPFMPLITHRLVFTVSPDFSSHFISKIARGVLIHYIASSLVLIQHGAPIMPTTHQVISQIYQKFGNGLSVIANASFNAMVFTATKIKDGTIFIAQSIIHAPVYLYNKVGQGLQQIPTAVTTGLIAGTVLLVAAKTI